MEKRGRPYARFRLIHGNVDLWYPTPFGYGETNGKPDIFGSPDFKGKPNEEVGVFLLARYLC